MKFPKNKPTNLQKKIWNQAVEATLKEIRKYDGLIPCEAVRNYLVMNIFDKISYKRVMFYKNPFTKQKKRNRTINLKK